MPALVRRPTVAAVAMAVSGALVLSGCTSDPDPELTGPTASESSASATPSEPTTAEPTGDLDASFAAQAVVKRAVVGTREVEFAVGPIVTEGETSVLPIRAKDVSAAPAGDAVRIHVLWGGLRPGAHGVRLLDAEAGTVEETAEGPGPLYTTGSLDVTAEELPMFVVFGAQTAPALDVLVPLAGLVADVPVVGADQAPEAVLAARAELVPDGTPVTARVASLDSFAVALDGASDTRVTDEEITVNIDADVLFAVDKADISRRADGALRAAARQFEDYEGGTLTVVGHTDDVGEADYNQELSERRAEAVRARLDELVDLDQFTVEVEGRGEDEPRASGTSAQARSLNRRVEIVLESATAPASMAATQDDGGLGASEGPTAPGAEGVTLEGSDGTEVRVSLAEVRRRAGLLVGEVQVSHVAGDVRGIGSWFAMGGGEDLRGAFKPSQQYTPANLTLVAGDQRYYPLDYQRVGEEAGSGGWPLTDLNVSGPLPESGSYTFTAVWPDVSGGAPTVTLDVVNPLTERTYRELRPPFRLTDVAIAN